MAFNLTTPLPFGLSASYYRITRITVDRNKQSVVVSLSIYLNQAARESNQPISSTVADLSSSYATLAEASLSSNLVAQCYTLISALPAYAGAVAA